MKPAKEKDLKTIRKRRQKFLATMKFPENGLPGSLSVSRFHCGKPSCHCNQAEGHEKWTLTYMVDGTKRVRHIPTELVESVRQRVEQGRTFRQAVNEIFGANAELLVLNRINNKKRKE